MLPKTMKALVAHDQFNYKFEPHYPVPVCGPEDIIIKTEGCGICAGDLKCKSGAQRFWGDSNTPSWVKTPFIPGHEFVGRVAKVGEEVADFKVGTRVVAEQILPCGKCRFCLKGDYWMCEPHATFGFQKSNNGGMAEYVRFPKNARIHVVPDELTLEEALLIEPYACSKHCIDRAQISNEDVVVIAGSGTLGLGMVTYARMKNPQLLIVLDVIESRLEKAREFGADLVWNPKEVDVIDEIKALTEGYGCDIYVEAAGHPSSVIQGMQMVRKLGRFVEFSVFDSPTVLDWSIIGDGKELDVLGSHLSPYCFPFVIDRISKHELATQGIVSRFFGLEEWEKAFEYASGKHGDLKVAIKF